MSNDNQIAESAGHLSDAGVRNAPQALTNLEMIRDHIGRDSFRMLLPVIITSLRQAGDGDMALNYLERFLGELKASSQVPDPGALSRILPALIVLFGASRFLSAFCISHGAEVCGLLQDADYLTRHGDRQALSARLAETLRSRLREDETLQSFRMFRKREMLRIGLRDLLGKADLSETVSDLSLLAEVCLQAAYERAAGALKKRHGKPLILNEDGIATEAGFAVIGMGKLGGGELNFSSDIDLMYVYQADGETEGIAGENGELSNRIANHQYFVKLAEQISMLIGKTTADGFVFRVDLRLRPEGQQGPLAQSLGGYEIYYESWGQTWERSALIKARLVAGDDTVGREFLKRVMPFVYRKYLDFGAIVEIRDMKQKINRDAQLKGKTHRDVKLGYGGIREIEFLIQALQLIYGGRDRFVRERGSLKALHILAQKGLLTYREIEELSKAYVFLRTVEHRIQILDDQQNQTLPVAEEELRSLARRTGYRDPGREAESLLHDYAEHTRSVRSIYDDLLTQAADTPEEREKEDFAALIDADTAEPEALAVLERYGFRNPERARRNLLLLREGQAFTHQTPRSRRAFIQLFPSIFREVAGSPDPDMALNHLESYLGAQGSWDSFQSVLRQDPNMLPVLISVFGSSEYLSRMLIRTPTLVEDWSDATAAAGSAGAMSCRANLASELSKAATITDKLDALRYVKKREELHIGMADLSGALHPRQVWKGLSRLAEISLEAALRLAVTETAKRYGGGDRNEELPGFAVAAAGKLGGREIIYGSDLDILFLYDETKATQPSGGLSAFEYMSRVAEKVISYLTSMTREGAAYRVDTRLRPTGTKGPLVTSLAAFGSYYAETAETWERQAMINTRFVAGDLHVGREAVRALHRGIFRNREEGGRLASAIRLMRGRMQTELGKEDGKSYNVKQGAGGLVDIEFLAQYLQLLYGAEDRLVRIPGTVNALRSLVRRRRLGREDGEFLIHAYVFLRVLESRMRVVANQPSSALSREPEKLESLARRLGYRDQNGRPAGSSLLEEYEKTSRSVRSLFDRIVAAP